MQASSDEKSASLAPGHDRGCALSGELFSVSRACCDMIVSQNLSVLRGSRASKYNVCLWFIEASRKTDWLAI